MEKRVIVWFRNDLRLHDNEALVDAQRFEEVLPVYVFDPRTYKGTTRDFGFPKTDVFRAKFLLESVANLRKNLRAIGSDLIVRTGYPEQVISDLAKQIDSNWVFCNRERTQEEVDIQEALESQLWNIGQELRFYRGKMLYYTADLPFPISQTPEVFTQFRKEVERITPIREPLPAPSDLPPLPKNVDPGELPTLEDLGYSEPAPEERGVLPFEGGEDAALKRLHYYLWGSDRAKSYKETRNQLLGGDFSTKFSPWLSAGCLSPKEVYYQLKKYEAERGANDSTYWIFFELLWRDFFRLMAKKHGNRMFQVEGIGQQDAGPWTGSEEAWQRWASGQTGVPFIDANMREFNATGFMSNRGRQNVASFLVKDLKIDWRRGAEYFESKLIDYDAASNWCNWNYVAGVGNDPRENRYFNVLSQASRYDPDGEYVRTWVPELNEVPAAKIHRPDLLDAQEQADYGVQIGEDYPAAIVPIKKWANSGRRKSGSKRGRRQQGKRKSQRV